MLRKCCNQDGHIGPKRGAAMGILEDRKRHKANKETARQRGRDYVANYFATRSCVDCGESDPVVLTFDHVRGTNSERTLSKSPQTLWLTFQSDCCYLQLGTKNPLLTYFCKRSTHGCNIPIRFELNRCVLP